LKGLDTNVLVRFLAQDEPAQSALAANFIETHCTDETPCFIGHIVLCELAWVLESNYHQTRDEIAYAIEELLHVGQLAVLDPEVVRAALNDYKRSNVDFPDHLLARVNVSKGCETTVTFDRKASKYAAFTLLE